jgi:ATP-binding cassette subfamily C protein CydD
VSTDRQWLAARAPAATRRALTLVTALQAILIVAQAGLLAWLVHAALVNGEGFDSLLPGLAGLLACVIGRALCETGRGALASAGSARVRARLRPQLLEAIAESGEREARRAGTGALSTRLVEQVDALDRWYARYQPQMISVSIVSPLVLAAVFSQDWLAGLFLAVAAPLIPFFTVLVGWGAEQASQRQQRELVRLGGVFLDRLRGMDTIRRYGDEARQLGRLSELILDFRERTMAVLRLAFLSTAVLEFFTSVAIAAVAIYVGLGLLDYIQFGPSDELTLFSGLFVLLLAPEFFQPLRQLTQAWHDRAEGLAAAADIRRQFDVPAARSEPVDPAIIAPGGACRLSARSLSFSYPGREPLFGSVDMDVEPGERLLIRGPSGGGKSTLLDLLGGFLSPTAGSICIDGIELDRIRRADLARLRAWMGQSGGLFDASLADNLRLADASAGDKALMAAVRLAGLEGFLERLGQGLATPLNASGEGLSGGQQRRILLARALVRPRPLLLLDEPTASLDPDTAAAIWTTLSELPAQRDVTVVCASHDRLAEGWADRIVELSDGRLEPVER